MKNRNEFYILIPVVVILLAFGTVMGYQMTPGQRAARVFAAGEKYLNDLNYSQAYAQFAKALAIDPNNEEVAKAVNSHLNELIETAEGVKTREECETTLVQIESALGYADSFDSDVVNVIREERVGVENHIEILDTVDRAEELFAEGKYKEAIDQYEEAEKKGATKEELSTNYELSSIYLKLVSLCNEGKWEEVANFIDSNDFSTVIKNIDDNTVIYIGESTNVIVGRSGNDIYVLNGKLDKEKSDGESIGVISGDNSYALYSGEWKELKPNGEGTLEIWNKRDKIGDAIRIEGTFADGLLYGDAFYTGGNIEKTVITAQSGNLKITGIDSEGNVQIDGDNGGYIISGIPTKNGEIDGYLIGVPGFGGSEHKIEVGMLDNEPPVFKCGLSTSGWKTYTAFDGTTHKYADGKYYNVSNIIGYNITATDNMDGDITSKIETSVSKGTHKDDVGWGVKDYPLTVKYTVTDSVGNTSTMTVLYFYQQECDIYPWYVMSVSYN